MSAGGFRAPRPRGTRVRDWQALACEVLVAGSGVRRGEGQIVAEAREALAVAAEDRAIERAREALEERG